jgi:thiamine pyrophosphate-dependent acetolactate synthase large subunit-like protein
MKRWDAMAALAPRFGDALVVACNGMIGRDLWQKGDKPTHFYMIGSMGLASSIGLGLALARPKRRVIVLDGDGNVLMNMGTLANIAAAKPANLYHLVLDNGSHASTGDQRTIAPQVPLDEIAKAAGYARTWRATDEVSLAKASAEFFAATGPVALLVKVEPGNQKTVPRVEIAPDAMTQRFRSEALK